MNKTKRTLIVSSVVMALVLVVTIVSVTAAWFSNVASSNVDKNFEIESTTLKETANISMDDDLSGSNTSAWPAVLKPGTALANGQFPRGKDLKEAKGNVAVAAKTAVFYFPINFIGSSDLDSTSGKSIDRRRSLMLKLNTVKLVLGTTDSDGNKIDDGQEYKSRFNVEMCLVRFDENKTATEIDLDGVYSDALSGTDVYYYQKTENNTADGEPCDEFYMLIIPGEEYYVRATIYFNEVDEQYDDLLYLRGKTLEFNFELTTKVTDGVDIRSHNKTPKTSG